MCSWTFVGKQNHAQELKTPLRSGALCDGDSAEVSRDGLAHSMWWRAQITQFPVSPKVMKKGIKMDVI